MPHKNKRRSASPPVRTATALEMRVGKAGRLMTVTASNDALTACMSSACKRSQQRGAAKQSDERWARALSLRCEILPHSNGVGLDGGCFGSHTSRQLCAGPPSKSRLWGVEAAILTHYRRNGTACCPIQRSICNLSWEASRRQGFLMC